LTTAAGRVFQRGGPRPREIRGRAGRRDSDERPSLGRRGSTSAWSEPPALYPHRTTTMRPKRATLRLPADLRRTPDLHRKRFTPEVLWR